MRKGGIDFDAVEMRGVIFEPFRLRQLWRIKNARAPMRIAAGEEICDIKEFQTMMDVGGIDVVQVDVTRVGGLARSKRIANGSTGSIAGRNERREYGTEAGRLHAS